MIDQCENRLFIHFFVTWNKSLDDAVPAYQQMGRCPSEAVLLENLSPDIK